MSAIQHGTVMKAYAQGNSGEAAALRRMIAQYDAALGACASKDAATLDSVLAFMQQSINFEAWPSLGLVLYAQYNTCRRHASEGSFSEAGRILATLRAAWVSGGRKSGAFPA